MPLPPLVAQTVDAVLGAFCRDRIPEHVRDQVRLTWETRGNSVTLVEERASFRKTAEWTRMPIAKLRYDPQDGRWTLHWRDRRLRWHPYDTVRPTPRLKELIAEIDRDPTGIFWG